RTRDEVNREAGSKRLLAHFTITPGHEGWLDAVDRAIELHRPDGWKGYTIGSLAPSRYQWRAHDEKLVYPVYGTAAKAGITTVAVHKGLFPLALEQRAPQLRAFAAVEDVGRAAKDWPQLNFAIYHSGYRHLGGPPSDALAEWQQAGRLSWLS